MGRENLSLRCKGRRPSGSNRKDQSTEAGHRGGAARRREEGSVMELDQRGCSVPPRPRANRSRAEVCGQGKAVFHPAWEWPNIGSRMTRECHVRFWERVGVRLPRATRQMCLMIAGQKHWLWRAVDQDGIVLDVLVQKRRDKQAAKRLLRKLLKRQCRVPRVMITDKLASYGAAKKEIIPGVEHRQHKGLNNRAENSHQPTRRRERQMKRFKSAGQAQRFLSAHDQINNLFHLRRDHVTASEYR